MADRSRVAGYVLGAVLGVPLLALAITFLGYLGWLGVAVAGAVTAVGAVVAWRARRHRSSSIRRPRSISP